MAIHAAEDPQLELRFNSLHAVLGRTLPVKYAWPDLEYPNCRLQSLTEAKARGVVLVELHPGPIGNDSA